MTSPVRRFFKFAELERRAAEPAKLFAQFFLRQRLFFRLGQRHGGFHLGDVSEFVARDERERFAGQAVDFHFNRPLKFRCVAGETLAQAPVQFGIVGLPQFVADVDAREINVAVAETQLGQLLAGNFEASDFLNFINASAFLLFLRLAGVENHAVAGFERARRDSR